MRCFLFFLFFCFNYNFSYCKENSAIVLMYHRFNQSEHPDTNISAETFEKQMQYLKENNFNVLPTSFLIPFFNKEVELPKKSVFITVDDAYKSVYDHAYPVLKNYNFPFSIFVSTKFVSNEQNSDFMSWKILKSLSDENVEILNHTESHKKLINLKSSEIKEEFLVAEEKILKNIGKNIKITSFPYGESNLTVEKVIKELNFKLAFSQHSSPIHISHNKLKLARFALNDEYGDLKRFKKIMNSKPLILENFLLLEKNLEDGFVKIKFESTIPSNQINCYINGGAKLKKTENTNASILKIFNLKNQRYRLNCTHISNQKKLYWFGKMIIKTKNSIFF